MENTSWADPTPTASYWVNKWNQLFVDAIRATGGKNQERNLVVMGPAGKSSKIAMEQFEMPADTAEKHLIFEFHNLLHKASAGHKILMVQIKMKLHTG